MTLLTIMAALNCEVKPWVDFHRLKKQCSKPFSVYQSDTVQIVVTGIGATSMATAVGWIGAQDQRPRVWLNIGTAGHASRLLGDVFRVHGSARTAHGRAHYPSMTARWVGPTDALLSLDTPSNDYPGGAAVDMEASAFFEAALRFSSSELVQSVKVVSDNADNGFEALDAKKITSLMQPHVGVVSTFAKAMCALSASTMVPIDNQSFERLRSIKASFSQQQQLNQLLHKVTVLELNDELIEHGLDNESSINTVLTDLRTLIEQAVPALDASVGKRS